jgi:(1->4)-alpha-D-glucan 1-alpha-D-glucosylmutase
MYLPDSTYRIQFNAQFRFSDLREQLDYLHQLGISTVYASPITRADQGSTHGYDVTDPSELNPEIGTENELIQISSLLKKRKMGWLQDIVPNHMALSVQNGRLMDVLKKGPASAYYDYFDINWQHPDFTGKLMLPVLEEPGPEPGAVKLLADEKGFRLQYKELQLPVSLPAVSMLKEQCEQANGKFDPETMDAFLAMVNADEKIMEQILDKQYYVLCYHRDTASRINYRRFFTVNSLICLKMEREAVFNDYHKKIHQLYTQQLFQGLRIDHIDGLADPAAYLKRLRKTFGADCYIVAEKILANEEQLPATWPIQGTTGYDFTAMLGRLFTVPMGYEKLCNWYQNHIPDAARYVPQTISNRMKILKEYMAGEWQNLYAIAVAGKLFPKRGKWKDVLAAFITCMPVYRIYPHTLPLKGAAKEILEETISAAMAYYPELKKELEYLLQLFQGGDSVPGLQSLLLLQRLMQFSGPVMAKGVEDTSFYTWNAFIARNEVGDGPDTVSKDPVKEFHAAIQQRFENWPAAMNATATHDTKRGEDARVRLLTIAEAPDKWLSLVDGWFRINQFLVKEINGKPAPSGNDEYFIYQSVTGGFPADGNITAEWIERLQQYITKAIREAKTNTSWDEPQQDYEQACMDFIAGLFKSSGQYVKQIKSYVNILDQKARIYSLSQLVLKLTVPGIPDIYQGCELYDYSFVDPDNRRTVDFELRKKLMTKMQPNISVKLLGETMQKYHASGIDKLFVCTRTLAIRRKFPELFHQGDYLPLEHTGGTGRISYARVAGNKWLISSVPLPGWHGGRDITRIVLPADAPIVWINVFTGEKLEVKDGQLPVNKANGILQVILLLSLPD